MKFRINSNSLIPNTAAQILFIQDTFRVHARRVAQYPIHFISFSFSKAISSIGHSRLNMGSGSNDSKIDQSIFGGMDAIRGCGSNVQVHAARFR